MLLKTVEEGPPYAAFLFCAENASVLLPTIRSRCVEVKLPPAGTVGEDDDNRAVVLLDDINVIAAKLLAVMVYAFVPDIRT